MSSSPFAYAFRLSFECRNKKYLKKVIERKTSIPTTKNSIHCLNFKSITQLNAVYLKIFQYIFRGLSLFSSNFTSQTNLNHTNVRLIFLKRSTGTLYPNKDPLKCSHSIFLSHIHRQFLFFCSQLEFL